jgi:hypothetical protein
MTAHEARDAAALLATALVRGYPGSRELSDELYAGGVRASGLATWVTLHGNGVQHALATNTRTECGRRLQGHDVTAQGPRDSLRRGCVVCTRRIDGYNAYGELATP